MFIGSHNTMSYRTPTNFIGKLIRWTSQCQDQALVAQIDSGITAVDIRVKFKGDKLVLAHGLVEYGEIDIFNFIDNLIDLDIKFIRIGLESFTRSSRKEILLFKLIIGVLRLNRRDIQFVAFIKHPYEEFVHEFDYVELQHSPQTLKEVLLGPRRLLKLQKPVPASYLRNVVFIDFV